MEISRRLSSNGSPLLRYGFLVIGLILWYSLAWAPLSGKIEELDSRIEVQEAKIGRLKRDIKRHRGVDQRIVQSKRRLTVAVKGLMPGDTPQLVASNLQDTLLKMASEAGLQVITYKTGRQRKWRDYQLAVAIFSAKTDIRKLVAAPDSNATVIKSPFSGAGVGERRQIDITLDSMDIYPVLDQVLGRILELNYVVDPAIKGTISLNIRGRYTKNELRWYGRPAAPEPDQK